MQDVVRRVWEVGPHLKLDVHCVPGCSLLPLYFGTTLLSIQDIYIAAAVIWL